MSRAGDRNRGPSGDDYLKFVYTYQKNSNVDSIIDSLVSSNTQWFAYDSLNQLIKVKMPADSQIFTYDSVGNRTSKNGTNYTYFTGTNRLQTDHRNYTYTYDNNGNIVKRSGGSYTDSLTYDWNNRLAHYKVTSGSAQETLRFVYNASGLRIKKYYRKVQEGPGEGEKGSIFIDIANDLGIKSQGEDSVYDKGRDIQEIQVDNSANYLTFTIQNQHLFKEIGTLKMFITLDIDTITNSGRISLPEDSMTRVSPKAAWEYCIYVEDDEYGIYEHDGSKLSKPFGTLMQRVHGDTGTTTFKLSKTLINTPPVIRYTVATFDPSVSNNNPLWQGGSSAADVYPGAPETFGGEVNGYGEISPLGEREVTEYTIFYMYNGINPVVEYSYNGAILARYVYANGRHIAKIAGADTQWYHCDILGTPRKMTNESGTVVWSATYYPFGEMTASGSAENTHGFTGKEYDSEMGLNYMCQRYYDPQIGRFTQLDPQNSPAASPYAYCANNPLVFTDPTGEAFDWKSTLMAGALGVYEGWKSGMRSYKFTERDEWNHLIGFDYYDPYSANNPYFELRIIPPAEYFGALYSVRFDVPKDATGKPLTYQEMIKFMRVLYHAAMYGGWRGKENALNYQNKYVINDVVEGEDVTGFGIFDVVRLDMEDIGDNFFDFAVTIFHEGCHVGMNEEYYRHKIIGLYLTNEAEVFARILYYRTYLYRWRFYY